MIIPLTTIPNPILFKKAVPVKKIDDKITKLIADMLDTFKAQDKPKAVGLSANQIGRPEKIFLALINKKIVPFINPEILDVSEELQIPKDDKEAQLEGCLSIPNFFGEVKRPKWVKLKYTTLIGRAGAANVFSARQNLQILAGAPQKMLANQPEIVTKTETFEGFPATIILHEMDHLEGRVFTEKLITQNGKLYQIIIGKNGKEEFEEVII